LLLFEIERLALAREKFEKEILDLDIDNTDKYKDFIKKLKKYKKN
jgi:hypothetical protein